LLSVTEQATEVLAKTLESNDVPDGQGLRLARNAAGEFGLAVDEKRDGDQIVEAAEREVLFVDETVSQALDGAVLDVTEAPDGTRLALRMPGEEPPEGDAAPTA
jgi:iron-sulfur cluster assembly protein